MTDKMKTYVLGDKSFEQRPLVWGQWEQLLKVIDGIVLPEDNDVAALIAAFKDRMMMILAIVLTETGKSVRGKNLEENAEEISFLVVPEQIIEVVTDFFVINPTISLLEKVKSLVGLLTGKIMEMSQLQNLSEEQSSSLPEET